MKFKIFTSIVLLFLICHTCVGSPNVDSLFTVLKAEINHERVYDAKKQQKIDLLRNHFYQTSTANFEGRYKLLSIIFEEYRSFRFDSAFIWINKMMALSKKYDDQNKLVNAQISKATILLNSGFYKESFDALEQIDANKLSNTSKSSFFVLRARLNAAIADYDNDAYFSKLYAQQSDKDFKSAETSTPSNDFEQTINLAFSPAAVKSKKLTPAFFFHLITSRHLSEHSIAMVATRVSYAYTGEDRILFLTLAAINDIRSSTKETLAIFLLGQEMFKMDRANDAYLLMQEAIKNAKFYGTRNRAVQIEAILPLIAAKVIDQKQHERDELLIGFFIFVIVAIILFFLLAIYRKQLYRIRLNELVIKEKNNELEKVNGKLWESSRVKEELIGLFFKTCSSYLETLDKVTRRTQHNLKLGKYKDANSVLGAVHIEKEKDQLYTTLDTVFLTLFPNFISTFNLLLKKEDQIWPKDGEGLTATLRIFALIRLGVTDLETIAKILDYTVSTVYTYKIRVKAKALVPADEFERKVMEIKFIDEL